MIKKIAFTMYSVRDMNRARHFYERILKLVPSAELTDGAWVEYDLDGNCFAITTLVGDVEPSASAGGSVAFEVDNVNQLVRELKAKGVRVKLEPFSTPVCRIAVVLDSEGNALTLHQVTK
jgi:predicted enzyme related to lactoylglutathione lyase